MAKENKLIKDAMGEESSIVKGWVGVSEYTFGGLNEQEKAQFEKAQFAEEQARKTSFVLGEPIKRSF